MRQEQVKGETVTLKVKYSDFTLITRSTTLPESTDDASVIYSTACSLLGKTAVGGRPVRLLGISISKLSTNPESQLSLFGDDRSPLKKSKLNTALDSIQEKFGDKSIQPGTIITKRRDER